MEDKNKFLRNSCSCCSQLSIVLGLRSVYQPKAFPFSSGTNYFTMRSPPVSTLLQMSMK
ncbi:hypothetical protein ES332_D05G322000v1 [Gossypium tomentosum]|uniref:Uncharacterized protein n=1 Tax=Gossypium tomentosum TaxID=34277 RepID=A0A5D2L5I1_GOSTO|nr:hypothetical protein ES332_D05G322000v1 [Gossypium tomentosum]